MKGLCVCVSVIWFVGWCYRDGEKTTNRTTTVVLGGFVGSFFTPQVMTGNTDVSERSTISTTHISGGWTYWSLYNVFTKAPI